MAESITALDVARARGVRGTKGQISDAEFTRIGIPLWGGCQECGVELVVYSAYPSQDGYWRCAKHIGAQGFFSLADFETWAQTFNQTEDARIEHELRRLRPRKMGQL